ncbi:nucleotide sugar dehydrogenase [Enterococcus casseliflavus]|uniref:Nucleotide sugar dehydrogenase n=1 Tax=Enterococcus casseliflavus TaxID=37734 RepID=A0AAW8UUE3_ENTCA|nr:nucleotide sugar dehydrogenase [Enterococcus casseliflavus]MDT2966207.1 nucleotide sugar dehydrogenase [Enterococcus casseliflavus]
MSLYEKILNKEEKISLIGLGYVGMPIAVAFAKKVDVIGFDLNSNKINEYKNGIDATQEVGSEEIKKTTVIFTDDPKDLNKAKFHIVAVPTPINQDKTPDLKPIIGASELLGQNLTEGSIVVYESTVYPGATEEICIPILEKESGLKCGVDFKVGYSPERINPGDKVHTLEKIIKIVSGMDEDSLNQISKIYQIVIEAGVHEASSIKVAEAAKVVENSQRDINIAFVNELAIAFDKMGIDTNEVIDAMNTKWNSLGFRPGLVGGHCIGVDPYYFIYQAENLGYTSQIISAGRKINDSMGEFVADALIKQLALSGKPIINAKVTVFGLTFKEDCPDLRNSKVIDIIKRLREYGIEPQVVDPWVSKTAAHDEYGVNLVKLEDVSKQDALVFAVNHREFKEISLKDIDKYYEDKKEKIVIDIKNLFSQEVLIKGDFKYWKL